MRGKLCGILIQLLHASTPTEDSRHEPCAIRHCIYLVYQNPAAWRWQSKDTFSSGGQETKAMNDEERTMWTFGETWNGNQVGVLHHRHHFRDWKISP